MDSHIDWRDYIHADPAILSGRPVVRGTRLGVEFLLELLAAGWTQEQVLRSYPHLSPEALRAVFAFVADASVAPGINDSSVVAIARERDPSLITHDSDFGELVYDRGVPASPPETPTSVAEAVLDLLKIPGSVIAGHFIVIDDERVRVRELPTH